MNREYRGMYFILTLFLCFIVLASHAETAFAATLKLPSALTTIGVEAFYGDNSIDIVQLPDTIERIESKAFANSSLKEINLPDSLRYIADDAFSGVTDISVTANEGSYAYRWADSKGLIYHPVTGISLDKSEYIAYIDITYKLDAAIYPENATNKQIKWSSSNPNIITVDEKSGQIRHKQTGTATITATTEDGGFTASCIITGVQPVTGIKLNKSAITLVMGASETLIKTVQPENVYNASVTWSSSNPSVATVDSTGKVTAVGIGTAVISVKTYVRNYIATCTVSVVGMIVSGGTSRNGIYCRTIRITSPTTWSATTSDSWIKLNSVLNYSTASKTMSGNAGTEVLAYAWLEVLPSTITTRTGHITFSNGISSYILNIVESITDAPMVSVSFKPTSGLLAVGKTVTLIPNFEPTYATDRRVTWTSDNTSIATVDVNGNVKGIAPGTAKITVKTTDGGFTAVYTVTVVQLHITPTYGIMSVGSSVNLQSSVLPATLSDFTTTWTSSDPSVLRIDTPTDTKQSPYIKVTGLKAGTSVVTGTTKLGGATCTYTVTVVSVALNKTSTTINVGNSETLTATVTPGQYAGVANSVTWTSSNNNATVDSNGKVTAKSPGTVTITATSKYGNAKASCYVTVTAPVTTAPTITSLTSNNDACSLKWTAVPNAVSYTVTVTHTDNGWQRIDKDITSTSWYSDWFGDGTYSFTVTAVGDSSVANNSRTSAAKEVTVKANEIKSGPAPTVTVNGTSAKLDWTEVDANATWYEIELWTSANFVNKLNGGSASYMKKIGGYNFDPPILHHATTHTFTGLSTGAYVVSVAGVNAGGHYCFGDSTGFVIGTPNNYPISSAPSLNLSSTGNSINCSWNAINNATQYDVFLVNSSGTTIKSVCLSPNKLNYTFSGLSNGNYWVEVYACNGLITNNDSLRYKGSGRQSVSVGISSGGTNNYPTSLYLTQSVSGRCTTASALMLIRAIAYKNGWNGWESITEDTADNVIRIPGEGEKAYWEYSFGGHSIIGQRYSQSGITIAGLKALLDAHPEGIEFYSHQSTSRQHAVFITDYVDNTFYCADPQGGYSGKRIKLEDSLLGYWYGSQSEILNKMTDYWCIISY